MRLRSGRPAPARARTSTRCRTRARGAFASRRLQLLRSQHGRLRLRIEVHDLLQHRSGLLGLTECLVAVSNLEQRIRDFVAAWVGLDRSAELRECLLIVLARIEALAEPILRVIRVV